MHDGVCISVYIMCEQVIQRLMTYFAQSVSFVDLHLVNTRISKHESLITRGARRSILQVFLSFSLFSLYAYVELNDIGA